MTLNTSPLWRAKDVCALIGVEPVTLWRWRRDDPTFPAPLKFGRSIRWRPEDINQWLDRKKGNP